MVKKCFETGYAYASPKSLETGLKKKTHRLNKAPKSKFTLHAANPSATSDKILVGKPWKELQFYVREYIIHSLLSNGFLTMLPVQEASIPLLLKNYDLAVYAQTGSGKTLAFLIPLLEKFLAMQVIEKSGVNEEDSRIQPYVKFLLISPTRELCQQTFLVLSKLLSKLPDAKRADKYMQYCHCVTGGNYLYEDLAKVKDQTYVLMGTVGRLREIAEHQGYKWLKKVDYLYIDEADRVIKEKGIYSLIRCIQKLRRTAMFSATLQGLLPKHYYFYGMRNLAKISLKPLAKESVTEDQTVPQQAYVIPKSLNNTYLIMKDRRYKVGFLFNFLHSQLQKSKTIVFFNTCASVDFYTKLFSVYFYHNGFIDGIHGKLKSKRRSRIINHFLSHKNGALFATDVVSRGIDFYNIHYIIQIDPPEDPNNYVHRIGRTARINKPGTAILLIEPHYELFIDYLAQKSIGVQLISDKSHFIQNNMVSLEAITDKVHDIMISDRDFIEKSKKAFVSYIRSYKEHDLKYVFEFKKLDIGLTAHSFFLYGLPRIKYILGKSISSFEQSDFDMDSVPWKDKNQELQYLRKIYLRRSEEQVKGIGKVVQKNYKNIKSQRKKIKNKNKYKYLRELNSEHKQILKSRKQKKITTFEDDNSEGEDTEQIEERLMVRE